MKRSEMLSMINSTLLRICGCDPDTGELLWPPNSYIAYCILKDVEQAGMAPPILSKGMIDDLLGAIIVTERKWEKE